MAALPDQTPGGRPVWNGKRLRRRQRIILQRRRLSPGHRTRIRQRKMPILISPASDESAIVAEQFDDIKQQRSAAQLGMWIFLATEVLFFGGLFLSYTVYRFTYGNVFVEASRRVGVAGLAWLACEIFPWTSQLNRNRRSLLAFRGHRLGFSLSAFVSGRPQIMRLQCKLDIGCWTSGVEHLCPSPARTAVAPYRF